MKNNNAKRAENIRVNISLPASLHKNHVKNAFHMHLSFSAYVRLCLEHYAKCAEVSDDSLSSEGSVLPFRNNS